MRVRVRFRFNAESGEVELFQIDDLRDGPPLADHDARHDRATLEVARIIENNALIEEVSPSAEAATPRAPHIPRVSPEDERADQRTEPLRE